MVSRFVLGALVAGVVAGPAAAENLSPEQARQFVAGKLFAFTCFDGTRGSGRIQHDGSVAGTIQFGGSGPVRYARLPVNTIRVGSTAVCASLKGLPFEPCFNLDKTSEASFRGSVSGMSFAYCEFRKHGNSVIMARAQARPRARRPAAVRSADASKIEVVSKVETPKVESEPLDLRRSTD
ncbi:hypothetical protein X566_02510 [Afipia sp. P52-10]|uniref:hypothetical protein n=1 Tax=Afipia sp. P52-10 TaxID=1429916 RepID=UPI0003DEF7ED|nr:hypothetical protein [Afipia sp. P52-10]ETR76629.1 hypothetical protein X566_02510 [Afipia sp. P52-10]